MCSSMLFWYTCTRGGGGDLSVWAYRVFLVEGALEKVEYVYDPLDGLGGITFAVDWDSRDCQDSASSNCPGSCRGVGFEMAEY